MKRSETDTLSSPAVWRTIYALLAMQLAVAFVIGYWHLLVRETPGLFQPIALTAIVPTLLFIGVYYSVPRVREFVLALEPRHLAMIHLWRVVGIAILPVFAFGLIPGFFAYPAGLGDVAVGIAAIYVLLRLERDPDYATSGGFVRFHVFGMLDLIIAMSAAALASGVYPALIPGGVTSSAMTVWPMNIFPSFFVPFFLIAHLMAFFNIGHRRRVSLLTDSAAVQPA